EWPANCEVRGAAPTREALYQDGDVLLFPARFNGIGLEQLEAMASGMPVIATDAPPMNESPCLDIIRIASQQVAQRRRARPILEYTPSASHLAKLLRTWHGHTITEHSRTARRFAESRSWQQATNRFMEAITSDL
ncbi:MAG: glycosyltransferase, partial [Planctomycetes bacterium]|nr:glycosyltransferase [Planctomycetota bacterium]